MMSAHATWISAKSLVDTGASACFINKSWVNKQQMTPMKTKPIQLALADGHVVASLQEAIELPVRHSSHTSKVLCYVAEIGKYDVILGMNWMEHHRPVLGFSASRSLTFDSCHCNLNCLHHGVTETIYDNRPPDSATRQYMKNKDMAVKDESSDDNGSDLDAGNSKQRKAARKARQAAAAGAAKPPTTTNADAGHPEKGGGRHPNPDDQRASCMLGCQTPS
jgi:predicted aspartyl protease